VTGTGKNVTPEELQELQALSREARNSPVMAISSNLPTFAESAQVHLQDRINELTLVHGCTKSDWNYGVNAATGEILE
jgi:hypothetical protein